MSRRRRSIPSLLTPLPLRKGITINTFMLDDSPVLRGFVDDLTRINKGRAFYRCPDGVSKILTRSLSS